MLNLEKLFDNRVVGNRDGRWKMEDGKWKMENGRWKMEDGKWKMENGALHVIIVILQTED